MQQNVTNQPEQMKGASQGWTTTTPKATYATGVFKGGSQGLAEEIADISN